MRYDTSGLLQRELRESGQNSRSLRIIRSKRPRIDGEGVSHNSLKRFKDLNKVECREYFRLKMANKRERQCHQKYHQREQWILEERI